MKRKAQVRRKLGVLWYLPEQWPRLLEVAADRDDLEDTWHEWQFQALGTIGRLRRQGVLIERVTVDVDEVLAWCREQGRPMDGAARAAFVSQRLAELEQVARERPRRPPKEP